MLKSSESRPEEQNEDIICQTAEDSQFYSQFS